MALVVSKPTIEENEALLEVSNEHYLKEAKKEGLEEDVLGAVKRFNTKYRERLLVEGVKAAGKIFKDKSNVNSVKVKAVMLGDETYVSATRGDKDNAPKVHMVVTHVIDDESKTFIKANEDLAKLIAG